MIVLVDTCVWSLAFRRDPARLNSAQARLRRHLGELIAGGEAVLPGVVRQELLSGMDNPAQFERLRRGLRALPNPEPGVEDYERATQAGNQCRARGVAGSTVDFLLCGMSLQRDWAILTTDADFHCYAEVLGLRLLPA